MKILAIFVCIITALIFSVLMLEKYLSKRDFENLKMGDLVWTSNEPVGDGDYVLTNPVQVNYIEKNDDGKVVSITLVNGETLNYKEFCNSGYTIDNE